MALGMEAGSRWSHCANLGASSPLPANIPPSPQVYLDFMLGNWIGEDDSQSQDMSGFFQLFAGLSATVIVFTYSANILGQWIGES